jgi:hypothetical protein
VRAGHPVLLVDSQDLPRLLSTVADLSHGITELQQRLRDGVIVAWGDGAGHVALHAHRMAYDALAIDPEWPVAVDASMADTPASPSAGSLRLLVARSAPFANPRRWATWAEQRGIPVDSMRGVSTPLRAVRIALAQAGVALDADPVIGGPLP